MKEIQIKGEFIQLDKLLKLADLAQTGGHAKLLIQDGLVKLNGEIEMRRGKKIRNGDIVELDDEQIIIKAE